MTRKEAVAYNAMMDRLGLSMADLDSLLRCERALTRWAERECGDGSGWHIERDETSGKPYAVRDDDSKRRYRIPDRETGAMVRAVEIASRYGFTAYHQTDPRGCSLYLLRPGDVPAGADVDSYYSRGIPVCIG